MKQCTCSVTGPATEGWICPYCRAVCPRETSIPTVRTFSTQWPRTLSLKDGKCKTPKTLPGCKSTVNWNLWKSLEQTVISMRNDLFQEISCIHFPSRQCQKKAFTAFQHLAFCLKPVSMGIWKWKLIFRNTIWMLLQLQRDGCLYIPREEKEIHLWFMSCAPKWSR